MILFSAEWCSQCPPVKERVRELGGEIKDMDNADNVEVAQKFNIRGLPSLVLAGEVYVGQSACLEVLRDY